MENDKNDLAADDEKLSVADYVIKNVDKAMAEGWIKVFYQPVVRTISGKLCGMEALARWIEPSGKFLSPAEFIPALENSGLITKVDLYILDEVCHMIRRKQDRGYINVTVSVNLSRSDFMNCDIVEEVERAVHKYGIARDMIALEITESMFVVDRDAFKRDIRRLRECGYKIWMDDFGSGYSSLNLLRECELDQIKLDMQFLRNFDSKSERIIRSIISMAKELGIHTLAEGVETQEHYDFLREIGCEKAQGYFISRPLAALDFKNLYLGREDEIELRLWRRYYEKIGEVNFITDKPLAIMEYKDGYCRYIYINDAYKDVLISIGIDDIDSLYENIHFRGDQVGMMYKRLLSELKTGDGFRNFEYPINNQYVRLRAKLLHEQEGYHLLQGELVNLTHNETKKSLEEKDDIFRTMSGINDSIYLLDLDDLSYKAIIRGNMFAHIPESGSMLEDSFLPEQIACEMILPENHDRFVRFIDYRDMAERIKKQDRNYITELFCTRADNSSYIWTLHTLQLIPGTNRVIYAVKYTPRLYDEMRNNIQGSVTERFGALIGKSLIARGNVCFFWKDTEGRFLGANAKFLSTFGFKDVHDIIGRTDEELNLYLDDVFMKEEETDSLHAAKSIGHKLRRCLIKGVQRDVIISKNSIFESGEMMGYVTSLLLVDELPQYSLGQDKRGYTDYATGLMNIEGIINTANEYAEGWEFKGEKFAVITMYFESYRRSELSYGSRATRVILEGIAGILLGGDFYHLSIGRSYGANFVLLARYKTRSEVESVAEKLESRYKNVHELGGYEVTLDPVIKVYYSEDVKDVQEMIYLAQGEYYSDLYKNTRIAQKKATEILSCVPAAIGVFSISDTYEVSRIYLSEQAGNYSNIAPSAFETLNDLVSVVHPEDRDYVYNTVHQSAVEKIMADMEFRCFGADGNIYWHRLVITPHMQLDGSYLLYGVYTDITELKNKSAALEIEARTDDLTDLKNRHAINGDTEGFLGKSICMALMDIEHFKYFNDNYSHDTGDKIIVSCAEEIQSFFEGDDCYRYGGDEFLIISETLDKDTMEQKIKEMLQVIRKKKVEINLPPVEISYEVLQGTPIHREDIQRMFRDIDHRLSNRKKNSGVYNPVQSTRYKRQRLICPKEDEYTLESLKQEFEHSELWLYVVDINTLEVIYINEPLRKLYSDATNKWQESYVSDDNKINFTPQNVPLEYFRGKKCYEVLQFQASPCAMCNNHRLTYDQFYEWDYFNPHIKVHFRLRDKLINVDGRCCRAEFITVNDKKYDEDRFRGVDEHHYLLNESARMAMLEEEPDASINILIEYMGRYLGADRSCVVERNEYNNYDNTYEWCRYGIAPNMKTRQNLSIDLIAIWKQCSLSNSVALIGDVEDIREQNPWLYEAMLNADIQSLILCPLWQNERIHGFFSFENPDRGMMEMAGQIMKTVGYFIESLMVSRDLIGQLEILSYTDHMTGLGNRHALDKYMEGLDRWQSLGVLFCDVSGLKKVNDEQGHVAGDMLLLRATNAIKEVFGPYNLFRIGGDEFVVVAENISREDLDEKAEWLRRLSAAKNAPLAIGSKWSDDFENESLSAMIEAVDQKMYEDKDKYYAETGEERRRGK